MCLNSYTVIYLKIYVSCLKSMLCNFIAVLLHFLNKPHAFSCSAKVISF